jgi:hypothetical protein
MLTTGELEAETMDTSVITTTAETAQPIVCLSTTSA